VIHEIGVELQAQLQSKLCPIPVIDGPEFRPTATFARERIVIERDMSSTDGYAQPGTGARHRADVNPRTLMTRVIAVKLTLYVKNPSAGSTYWEHQRRLDTLLDMVLCGLYNVVKPRQNLLTIRSGKYVLPEDLKASETPGGAVYELLVTIDRGVADRNWDGTAEPTYTVPPGTVTTTTVSDPTGGNTETLGD
jgi:hypothetical protein